MDTAAELNTYQCDIELVMAYDNDREKLMMQGEMNSRYDNINKNMYWVWKINSRLEDKPFNPSDAYIDENYLVDGRGYEKSSGDDTWHKSRGLTEYYEQIMGRTEYHAKTTQLIDASISGNIAGLRYY
jgi:hypothetical protein